jgi:ribonucleoside-diphosphate reductase alpha chain
MAIATKRKPSLIGKAYFTHGCNSRQEVYDKFEWGSRDAVIRDREGKAIFEQTGMNFPTAWSDTAVQIVSQKYFKGPLGTEMREGGLRQMIDRVVDAIRQWGIEGGYFATTTAAEIFGNELAYLIADQRCSFNSPVWFNVGTKYASTGCN